MAESQQIQAPTSYDEVDLLQLLRIYWQGKWLIGGFTLATMVAALIVVFILPNTYRAEALLTPNSQEGAGDRHGRPKRRP